LEYKELDGDKNYMNLYTSLGILLVLVSIGLLFLALDIFRKRYVKLNFCFFFLVLSVFFWCLGAGLEFLSVAVWAKIFWSKISYLGSATAATLWFFVVLSFLKYDKYVNSRYLGLLLVWPFFVIIMAITNEWHGLIWPYITPASSIPGDLLIYGHGPVFWGNYIYSFFMVMLGLVVLIRNLAKSSLQNRPKIYILIFSGLIPLVFNFLYVHNLYSIPGLDITPLGLTISVILILIGIIKFHLFDIHQIARKLVFGSMKTGVMVFDIDDNLIDVNPAAQLIQVDQSMQHKKVNEVLGHIPTLKNFYEKFEAEEEVYLTQPVNRWIQVRITPIFNDDDNLLGRLLTFNDISEIKNAEQVIKESLDEKELLLREIHHRVKNNLQIISSLLKLQSSYIKDEASEEVLKDSQDRVNSIALIHQKLYQSENFKQVEMSKYIEYLVKGLCNSYGVDSEKIKIKTDLQNISLDIDTAIPLGLIINEIITNSIKHAFPEDHKGEIQIKMTQEGEKYQIVMSDNGIGLPEDLDVEKTETLGMRLISNLVRQIDGRLELKMIKGTEFRIKFP
jgi:two-component sensor histidine kinase/PAS domain-containing protein